jgi:uncharacterized protein (TIGR00730 family)
MKICVFCSSSNFLDKAYHDEAVALGSLIAENGFELVYGGTTVGLMGIVADEAKRGGAMVTGVIPSFIKEKGIANPDCNNLFVTDNMRDRKAKLEAISDAFIALPGGFGTLEEIFEVITLKQLQRHDKPIVFINTGGFYNHLVSFVEIIFQEKFASDRYRDVFVVVGSAAEAIDYIKTYRPTIIGDKWGR